MRTPIWITAICLLLLVFGVGLLVGDIYVTRYEQKLLNDAHIECIAWQAEGRIISREAYCYKIIEGSSAIIKLSELKEK